MTPGSSMVLTGKQALDFSGGVSADDNFGIGGYERVMGPNGQAQYWAPSLADACELLLHHYEYTYVKPGERFPRRIQTTDPPTATSGRSRTRRSPTATSPSSATSSPPRRNPERKKPFDVRSVMRAVTDPTASRWSAGSAGAVARTPSSGTRASAASACACSAWSPARSPRRGFVPADGPPSWTSGTLFPQASRKTARAVTAASGNRPLVVLANLSGFDGSPESMRHWQLEYGAEIGRAVTNFNGPDRVRRHLALPRRGVRGVLQGAEPPDGGRRGRGLLRVGDRRRPRGGHGVRP